MWVSSSSGLGHNYSSFVIADINECSDGTALCATNADCTNTPGSFTCDCNRGYSGNGLNCVGK